MSVQVTVTARGDIHSTHHHFLYLRGLVNVISEGAQYR